MKLSALFAQNPKKCRVRGGAFSKEAVEVTVRTTTTRTWEHGFDSHCALLEAGLLSEISA